MRVFFFSSFFFQTLFLKRRSEKEVKGRGGKGGDGGEGVGGGLGGQAARGDEMKKEE